MKNVNFTYTPIFTGDLGNMLYQISVCLNLALDHVGQAIFYKQISEPNKNNDPLFASIHGEGAITPDWINPDLIFKKSQKLWERKYRLMINQPGRNKDFRP